MRSRLVPKLPSRGSLTYSVPLIEPEFANPHWQPIPTHGLKARPRVGIGWVTLGAGFLLGTRRFDLNPSYTFQLVQKACKGDHDSGDEECQAGKQQNVKQKVTRDCTHTVSPVLTTRRRLVGEILAVGSVVDSRAIARCANFAQTCANPRHKAASFPRGAHMRKWPGNGGTEPSKFGS
jgi:hypothetical protein